MNSHTRTSGLLAAIFFFLTTSCSEKPLAAMTRRTSVILTQHLEDARHEPDFWRALGQVPARAQELTHLAREIIRQEPIDGGEAKRRRIAIKQAHSYQTGARENTVIFLATLALQTACANGSRLFLARYEIALNDLESMSRSSSTNLEKVGFMATNTNARDGYIDARKDLAVLRAAREQGITALQLGHETGEAFGTRFTLTPVTPAGSARS